MTQESLRAFMVIAFEGRFALAKGLCLGKTSSALSLELIVRRMAKAMAFSAQSK